MSPFSISARLSIMMFLQFFIWGAWYVTVGIFMGENGMGDVSHWAYTVGPLAAVISPFFLGMIADRYFDVEKVLGVMHLLGGVALLAAPFYADSPVLFIVLLAVHMVCYMPTIGLTNTLAFHNITDQEKQFPLIRVFGTIGWIVAGCARQSWPESRNNCGTILCGRDCLPPDGFIQFFPSPHATSRIRKRQYYRSGNPWARRAGAVKQPAVYHFYGLFFSDLYSASDLLQFCADLRQRRRTKQCRLQNVLWPDVRSPLYGRHALLF